MRIQIIQQKQINKLLHKNQSTYNSPNQQMQHQQAPLVIQHPSLITKPTYPVEPLLSPSERRPQLQDKQDALYHIWQSYKKCMYLKLPTPICEERNKAVYLMMECHRILKLPLETLFLGVLVFDKVLTGNFVSKGARFRDDVNVNILGIACLYSCQKLQKIRNYGVSHWLKHLSVENLTLIGYPSLILTSDCIKKYQAYIMQTMSYNLFSSTLLDILLGIWTLKPPTQKQFYFGHYLLQLSLYWQLCATSQCPTKQLQQLSTIVKTAQSYSQNSPELLLHKDTSTIYLIDIAIAIADLGAYFFGKEGRHPRESREPRESRQSRDGRGGAADWLIKKIWGQVNGREFETRKAIIKQIANQLFEKVRMVDLDKNCKKVVQKYKKHTNFAISTYKFIDKQQVLPVCKGLTHSTHLFSSETYRNTNTSMNLNINLHLNLNQNQNMLSQERIKTFNNMSSGYVGSTGAAYEMSARGQGGSSGNICNINPNDIANNNANRPDSARDLSFRSL